ncbi:DAO-domain-containing protein [Ascobolus immersus RN42]|uniref:Glycerol-3-phosphate dehydrogenase n=1 Tax=Ascobolus immersus RN42 TaxID=1160509 RepID=A0A3N4HH34_ASCIM|nr:DAO-domain-containing protein [Ascobolus immersus RN42]
MASRFLPRATKPLLYTTALATTTYTLYRTTRHSLDSIDTTTSPHNLSPPSYLPLPSRLEQFRKLQSTSSDSPYDLVIIGGGATGCGIAVDAASRGLKVALVERDDFSSGTSSKSTKLVHGGVRYLEKAVKELDWNQYELVKEALKERAVFLKTAPHLSMSLPIMLPIYTWWKLPYFWAGTKFYDFLAGGENLESSYFLTRSKALTAFPMLKKEGLVGSLVYYDGSHNDSRMNVALATTAAQYGATIVNHAEVVELTKDKDGRINGVVVKDVLDDKAKAFSVASKGVINATGPYTDSIRHLDTPTADPIVAPSSGTHLVLPGYYSPLHMGLIDPSTSDGRVIFFLPWQGNTIAGTTDSPTDITQHPLPKDAEIDWILAEVRRYLSPEINVRRGDVLAAWTGIRPLVKDPNAKNTESLVRNHLLHVSENGLLTIAGGKWTTYRQMAEETVDLAIDTFNLHPSPPTSGFSPTGFPLDPRLPFSQDGRSITTNVPLTGAHGYSENLFISLIQSHGLDTTVARHLAHSYGTRAHAVAQLSAPTGLRFPVRGERLSELYPFVDGEVRYCVREEYAQTASDILARRTRLAFLNVQAALEALPRVVDIMAEELHWDGRRKEREWRETVSFLESMGLPSELRGVSRKAVENGIVAKLGAEYSRHLGTAKERGSFGVEGTESRAGEGKNEGQLGEPIGREAEGRKRNGGV